MMEEIANQVADAKLEMVLEQIREEAQAAAYQSFCNNLNFDVSSCVEVAFADGETIFKDKHTQQVIADRLTQEIQRQMNRHPITVNI